MLEMDVHLTKDQQVFFCLKINIIMIVFINK